MEAQRGQGASQGHTTGRKQSWGLNLITFLFLLPDPGKPGLGVPGVTGAGSLALDGFPHCLQPALPVVIQPANAPDPILTLGGPWGGRS